MSIADLNAASALDCRTLLRQCCTSEAWIDAMVSARPFSSDEHCTTQADAIWSELSEGDFLQAFEGHPKIGDVNSLKAKYADTKALAAGEQSSVDEADDSVIQALAEGNARYDQRYGFIFIVCATGKSATEMLALLEARLHNSREDELVNAAEEQRKIFQLRLKKLL